MFQVLEKIKPHYGKVALLATFLLIGVLITPGIAKAGPIANAVGGAIKNIVLTVMKYITVWPLKGATSVLNWVLEGGFLAQDMGYQPHNNDIIKAGWQPVRNFANMFFIIALIVIGIATALQYKEYQAQKALPKLLIIALLINFTPALAAAVINLSDTAMEAFLAEAGAGGFTTIEQEMDVPGGATAKSLQGYVDSYLTHLSNQSGNFGPAIGKGMFLMLFGWGATVILLMFSVLFMARYLILWIFIIISPLAFISYVFPASKKKIWDPWWEQFVNWTIIGIPAGITLLLGKEVLLKAQEMTTKTGMGDSLAEGLISFITAFTLPLLFLYIGYIATLKVGAMGSEAVVSGAKTAGKWAAGATGAGLKKGAEATGVPDRVRNKLEDMRTAQSIGEREEAEDEEVEKDYGAFTRMGSSMAAPTKRAVGRWALRRTQTTSQKVEDKTDNIDDEDVGERVSKLKGATTNKAEELAEILAGIKNGQLRTMRKMGLGNKKIKEAVSTASKMAPRKAKEIINAVPTIADDLAVTLSSEHREDVGLDWEDEEEKDKYGGSHTAKIAGNLDLNDIENLTEDEYKNNAVQYGMHLDWSGRELGKAGQELGRSFVEEFNKRAQRRGKQWYIDNKNEGLPNYLGNSSAQDMGYQELSDKGQGEIIKPSSQAPRKKIVKPGQEEETGPRGSAGVSGTETTDSQDEGNTPRGRSGPGGTDQSDEEDSPPRGRMGV